MKSRSKCSATTPMARIGCRRRIHSFLLRQRAMTPAVIKDAMAQWEGARGWPSWSLSNHDVIRFPTRLADNDPQRTKLMMALLLALRGTAFIYQGDELGLPHGDVSFERLRDPEAIAFWPSGIGRDGARTPMPWSRDENMAGFTKADDAWLPLDPRHRALAVDAQGEGSMLAFTRAADCGAARSAALREGEFIALDAPEPVLAFERRAGDQRMVCLFNLGPAPVKRPLAGGTVRLAIGEAELLTGAASLGGYSGLLVEI
jgi:alpha-glucosidase